MSDTQLNKARLILSGEKLNLVLRRLCYQIIERHGDFSNSVLVGLQPRGIYLARALADILKSEHGIVTQPASLDISFYRDDFNNRRAQIIPAVTEMPVEIENRKVIIVDDVLFTGRTIRSGMDALVDFGRPALIELLTLVDRRSSRQVPIEPDYSGISVDTRSADEKVKVQWVEQGEDANRVWLVKK